MHFTVYVSVFKYKYLKDTMQFVLYTFKYM